MAEATEEAKPKRKRSRRNFQQEQKALEVYCDSFVEIMEGNTETPLTDFGKGQVAFARAILKRIIQGGKS